MPKYEELNYREINMDQVKKIMKEDYAFFAEVLDNVFCSKCFNTTIKDYNIYLDELGYIILQGFCAKCSKKVARVIETAEDPVQARRAKKIYKQLKSQPVPAIRQELIEKTDKYIKEMQEHYRQKVSEMPYEEEKELLEFLAETKRVNSRLKEMKNNA